MIFSMRKRLFIETVVLLGVLIYWGVAVVWDFGAMPKTTVEMQKVDPEMGRIELSPKGATRTIVRDFDGKNPDYDTYTLKIDLKEIGKISEGKYKGSMFLSAKIDVMFDGPCSPPGGCEGNSFYARFVETNDKIIQIRSATPELLPWESGKYLLEDSDPFANINPFSGLGKLSEVDEDAFFIGFQIPEQIKLDGDGRKSVWLSHETEKIDEIKYEKFRDTPYGAVYTLRPANSIANETLRVFVKGDHDKFRGYARNVFYIKKPDGIFSVYVYRPDIYVNERVSNDFDYRYLFNVFVECDGVPIDDLDVVTSLVDERDLVKAGESNVGDPLYYPPERLLINFHRYYEAVNKGEFNAEDGDRVIMRTSESEEPNTYEEFAAMTPMLLWKSPLGQWVRLSRVRFLQPMSCRNRW